MRGWPRTKLWIGRWSIAFGTPVDPFGLMDMIELDGVRDIKPVYYRVLGDVSDAPPHLL